MQSYGGARRGHLIRIFDAAVRAVDPTALVRAPLWRSGPWAGVRSGEHEIARWRGSVLVVGAGKAAARMAAGCEAVFGLGGAHGLVITADGCGVPLRDIACIEAGHPTPDRRGLDATARILALLDGRTQGPVLCLVSGGASSLLVQPRGELTLADKRAVSQLLLASGVDIAAMNAVRKHLSLVKGGGLLRFEARPLITLILSDVVGDDPSVIGSGPTVPDPSTFADAAAILEGCNTRSDVPEAVVDVIERGVNGELPETVKPGDPRLAGVTTLIVGNNATALASAAAAAEGLGYETHVIPQPLTGATVLAAREWLRTVRRLVGEPSRPICVLSGGETTVTVAGKGRGGRNQEFALALVEDLEDEPFAVLSAGTDGIDGPTDAAGAFVDGRSWQRARDRGLDPAMALAANDSYGFFAPLDDLFRPGPTGTNVMDIKIVLAPAF